MHALIDTVGQVKSGTKWTYKGDLNIYPSSTKQKKQLLDLKVVNNLNINCTLAMSEASIIGVIRNVPTKDKEEDILSLLADQGVVKVQRFSSLSTDGSRIPLKTVTLYFNTLQLPREVIMAHEVFPVKQFIPRPALCRICWNFGHPEEKCTAPPTCKQCAEQHCNTTPCNNPTKCPTCLKPGHPAVTMECPKYNNRQQIIKFAYENRIPITEASKILNNPEPMRPTQLPKFKTSTNTDPEVEDLRREIDYLRKQIEGITIIQPTTTARIAALEDTVADIQEKITPLTNLPSTIEKIKKDMESGFTSNNTQLSAITALLQSIRPPAKPPNKPPTNTTDKSRK